jgi:hypothetical protein
LHQSWQSLHHPDMDKVKVNVRGTRALHATPPQGRRRRNSRSRGAAAATAALPPIRHASLSLSHPPTTSLPAPSRSSTVAFAKALFNYALSPLLPLAGCQGPTSPEAQGAASPPGKNPESRHSAAARRFNTAASSLPQKATLSERSEYSTVSLTTWVRIL